MTQTIRLGNKLIKLIKFLTGKETHKTHKLIREGCAIISTEKQTHKTHKTHDVSTGNKLIKLIKRGGLLQQDHRWQNLAEGLMGGEQP